MAWLIVLVVVTAAAVIFKLGLVLIFLYMAAALAVASRVLARHAIMTLEAGRHCSASRLHPGEPVQIEVQLRNPKRARIPWVLAEDHLPAVRSDTVWMRCAPRPITLLQWTGQPEETFSYQVTFLHRGYYRFGPILLESGDWFGLSRRVRVLPLSDYILVYPRVLYPPEFDFAAPRPGGELRSAGRLFEDPTRIAGVRPYLPGDPLNRIHWRATARSTGFQSKLCEPAIVSGATFILDFDRSQLPRDAGPVELGVTTVASLARHVFAHGLPVGFFSNGTDGAREVAPLPSGVFSSRREAFETMVSKPAPRTASTPDSPPHSPTQATASVNAVAEDMGRLNTVLLEAKSRGAQFDVLLEILARLQPSDCSLPDALDGAAGRLTRETVLVPVLYSVSEETAIALGMLRRSGFTISALMIQWGEGEFHDWALAPEWAERLLAQGIRFRVIGSEEALLELLETPLFA